MDKSYNNNIRPLLDLAEKLTVLLKDTSIKLPKIATCGMQSHGKSSLLEYITHISLPKGTGMVTACPIEISLRNAKDKREFARIKFELDSEEKYEKISLNSISNKIQEYQNKVKEENRGEKTLFYKVIQVEVNRKNAPDLNLYDMPGFICGDDTLLKKADEINSKFIREEGKTVLLVLSGKEEPSNPYVVKWMKNIPGYNRRFNPIITHADDLRNKDKLEAYLNQINTLGIDNPPSLIINKFEDYKNLSYKQMEKKELELLNEIPNLEKFNDVNIGLQSLIQQLIKKQKEDLKEAFSNMAEKVKKEINKKEKLLKDFPKPCNERKDFFALFSKYIEIFKAKISNRRDTLEYNDNNIVKADLLKYHIAKEYRKHIKKVKSKINELFTSNYCTRVTGNINKLVQIIYLY